MTDNVDAPVNDDILDLDALMPQPKKIKIKGKILEAYPPTTRQILKLQRAVENVQKDAKNVEDIETALTDALVEIVPAIKDDASIDFSIQQLVALITYMIDTSVPQSPAKKEFSPQKKTDSAEQ